jgi:hypothetical protein
MCCRGTYLEMCDIGLGFGLRWMSAAKYFVYDSIPYNRTVPRYETAASTQCAP